MEDIAASDRVVCQEQYGPTPKKHEFVLKDDDRDLSWTDTSVRYSSVSNFVRDVFLPQGYPDSVSKDYLPYQIWDTIQGFASSIIGTLAAHAVLKGVGVGDETATVMGATITWLLKDGTGMLGRIIFAWSKGTRLDYDCKRWRMFADILNDISVFFDMIAPSCGSYFTVVLCIAGVCRNIVGVTAVATRAALTQHQARRNNMADVSAKDGSQETLVRLAALLCSLILVPLVSGHQIIIWTLFVTFSTLHLFANYKAITAISMETINQARLHLIVKHYLETEEVLDVKTINYKEPILFPVQRQFRIRLGVSLTDMARSVSFPSLMDVYDRYMERYILGLDLERGNIDITLGQNSTVLDQLQACFHAELINFIFHCSKTGKALNSKLKPMEELVRKYQSSKSHDYEETARHILATTLNFTETLMTSFIKELQDKGWVTEIALLGADEWRASWNLNALKIKKLK